MSDPTHSIERFSTDIDIDDLNQSIVQSHQSHQSYQSHQSHQLHHSRNWKRILLVTVMIMLMVVITIIAIVSIVAIISLSSSSSPSSSSSSSSSSSFPSHDDHYDYYPSNLSPFVKHLISQMSLREKIGQMAQLDILTILSNDGVSLNDTEFITAIKEFGIGSFLNSPYFPGMIEGVAGMEANEWISFVNHLQSLALSHHNHSIPIIYGLDSVHGANYIYGATMFPHNLGLGATFNRSAVSEQRRITAKDTRASGIPWNFDPVADIGINPLWPRLYETFGEDPYVAAQMVEASIKATQGANINSLSSCASTLKHFIGYSDPRSGKDRSDAWIDRRRLLRYFLPSFKAGIDAGARAVMVNSGSINGVPVHASRDILTRLLRQGLKFEGVVVTDYRDIEKLTYVHRIAPTLKKGIQLAIEAGIDMSMVPMDYSFPVLLEELVHEGTISERRVEASAARILQLKEDLGLFDSPLVDPENSLVQSVGSTTDRQIALDITRESIVLLSNDGVLPLANDTAMRILVVGPCGNSVSCQCGGWSVHWQGAIDQEFAYGTSIFRGIQQHLEEARNTAVSVQYVEGATFTSLSNIDEAVEAAEQADVIILAVGEPPEAEILGNINFLDISTSQQELYEAITRATTAPIITIVVAARPRILNSLAFSSAVIMSFLPGPAGGEALAEILFGQISPSGKLPITYPRSSGDLVPYYHLNSADTAPLFEFGHGLSYTRFEYLDMQISTDTIVLEDLYRNASFGFEVTVVVRNAGSIDASEAILVFVSDLFASVSPEVKMLKAFEKISIAAGQTIEHVFTLRRDAFEMISIDYRTVVEEGSFRIRCGALTRRVSVVREQWLHASTDHSISYSSRDSSSESHSHENPYPSPVNLPSLF